MFGGGIAFVLSQAILGIDGIPFLHAGIAMRFGQDGGGGDRDAAAIAFDERFLLDEHVKLDGVEEQVIGNNGQLLERRGHSLATGLIDIPGIDPLGVDLGDRTSEGVLANALSELRAAVRSELLGVVETHDAALGIEYDGGGNHRAKQRAAAGFVEARDTSPAQFACCSFETRGAKSAHSRKS